MQTGDGADGPGVTDVFSASPAACRQTGSHPPAAGKLELWQVSLWFDFSGVEGSGGHQEFDL